MFFLIIFVISRFAITLAHCSFMQFVVDLQCRVYPVSQAVHNFQHRVRSPYVEGCFFSEVSARTARTSIQLSAPRLIGGHYIPIWGESNNANLW